jgi:hypothetical protein
MSFDYEEFDLDGELLIQEPRPRLEEIFREPTQAYRDYCLHLEENDEERDDAIRYNVLVTMYELGFVPLLSCVPKLERWWEAYCKDYAEKVERKSHADRQH